ncbi:Uncharacterised protein [Pseudomonas aeruginosa]|nr:Uncharacterised protein [Pseudomonas aeruginosa]
MVLYSVGVMVASTAQACTSWSKIRETLASIFSAGPSLPDLTCSRAARSSWSISFIHSSEVWCWMMNSISLWSGESGNWASRTLSSFR